MAEGAFHEAMNLAALWQVPVLFVCENNLYAMGTALRYSHAMTELEKKSLIVANPPEEAAGFRRQLATAIEEGVEGLGAATAPATAPAAPIIDPTKPGALPTPKPIDVTVPEIPPPAPPPPPPPAS